MHYTTADGSAAADSDDTATRGVLTFAAGQTQQTIQVEVSGDTRVEPNETFLVQLSDAVGATIFAEAGLGTILNDDGPVFRITNVRQREGNRGQRAFTFHVTLLPASASAVTVDYATADGSAVAGSDYTATSGTLTFAAGQTSQPLAVAVLGDTMSEPHETFTVQLRGAVGATIFAAQGLGTIRNDDSEGLPMEADVLPESDDVTQTP